MTKFWFGAICASLVFVATWFVVGGKMAMPTGAPTDMPVAEETAPANPMESLSRAPDSTEEDTTRFLNKKIFAIKNTSDVNRTINEIIAFAKANPNSKVAQIYATFVTPIPKFEGITWRLRNIVESVDVAYIASIAYLRAFKRNSDRRAPHLDVLFNYFTDPIPDRAKPFATVTEFQNFMTDQVAPTVNIQLEAYKEILKNQPVDVSLFDFDAALILGEPKPGESFASTTNRYRKYMPAHLKAMMANMHERLGFGLYAASYDMEGLANFMNTLSRKSLAAKKANMDTGSGGAIIADALNLGLQTPKEVSKLLQNKAFEKFLKIRPEAIQRTFLKSSYSALIEANRLRLEAYEGMTRINSKADKNRYFSDADFITSRPAIDEKVLKKRRDLLKAGVFDFADRVNGTKIKINISRLFDENNTKIHDLKTLYPKPTQFKNDEQFYGKNRNTFKWNYEYGAPQGWPDTTFAGLLPETTTAQKYKKELVSISRDASAPALTYWLRLFM